MPGYPFRRIKPEQVPVVVSGFSPWDGSFLLDPIDCGKQNANMYHIFSPLRACDNTLMNPCDNNFQGWSYLVGTTVVYTLGTYWIAGQHYVRFTISRPFPFSPYFHHTWEKPISNPHDPPTSAPFVFTIHLGSGDRQVNPPSSACPSDNGSGSASITIS